MKKLRVLMLVHYTLVPPDDLKGDDDPRVVKFRTEYDVKQALLKLGHEVKVMGVYDDFTLVRKEIEEWKPHIAFNLLEDFAGNSALDYYAVSFLGMMKLPFTGCNPRGLLLARDKALSKKILAYDQIIVPNFTVFRYGQRLGGLDKLQFPLIVKSLIEEGSIGIARASVVENAAELQERVNLIHERTQGDAIAEEYIDGRELYVTVLGNYKLDVLPIRELVFSEIPAGTPKVATYRVKWNEEYRKRSGIEYQFARTLPNGMVEEIGQLAKRIYRTLDMSGYARLDFRLTPDNKLYVLEANPNPGIARDEDSSLSAIKAGMSYEDFIQRLLTLGLAWRTPGAED